jgi:hypothetical protein
MRSRASLFLIALLTGVLAFGLCPAQADDVEAVKEKLFQAKKAYDAEVKKFKKAVADLLDKREEDARKKGNKKQVDQIKAEREAFEKTGEPPQMILNSIQEPVTAVRTKLDKAFTAAIKEYLKLKMDDAANATEKEQQEFQLTTAFLFGKRSYLVSLHHSDLKIVNATGFSNNGTDALSGQKLKRDGEFIPHSIFIVPPANGSSEVSYPVPAKKVAIRTTVGVTKIGDDAQDPATGLIFEVLGDGKSLWKSKPVSKLDMYETCELKIEKVKILTLRVNCSGPNTCARAMWYEPILVE